MALLLVGCTTTETKPVSTDTASVPAKVTPPAVKAVKPVLKPNAAVKPKTAPVTAVEPAPVNSDAVLGKQWARCAGRVNGLYLFGQDAINLYPSILNTPSFKGTFSDYKKLPVLRDSFYAYATAATSTTLVDAEFKRLSASDYSAMKGYLNGFFKAVEAGENFEAANNKWGGSYFKHGVNLLDEVMTCALNLEKYHARFDAQVPPSLQVETLGALLANTTKPNLTIKSLQGKKSVKYAKRRKYQ